MHPGTRNIEHTTLNLEPYPKGGIGYRCGLLYSSPEGWFSKQSIDKRGNGRTLGKEYQTSQ